MRHSALDAESIINNGTNHYASLPHLMRQSNHEATIDSHAYAPNDKFCKSLPHLMRNLSFNNGTNHYASLPHLMRQSNHDGNDRFPPTRE